VADQCASSHTLQLLGHIGLWDKGSTLTAAPTRPQGSYVSVMNTRAACTVNRHTSTTTGCKLCSGTGAINAAAAIRTVSARPTLQGHP
jgi:hypothetical protein